MKSPKTVTRAEGPPPAKSKDVIPKRPRFYERAEGSPVAHCIVAGDPFAMRLRAGSSLRLKSGRAQDGTIERNENSK